MTSTVESAVETLRLAVAIADGFTDGNEPFGEANDAQQRRYLAAARAVISVRPAQPAASEVTDAMEGPGDKDADYWWVEWQMARGEIASVWKPRCERAEAALASTRGGQGTGERTQQAERALERDRSLVARHLGNVRHVIEGYSWLREAGRGSYAYDDDRYQREFGNALDALDEALEPLRKIARDWSNCPINADEIKAARAPLPTPHPDPSAREALAKVIWSHSDFDPEDSWDDAYLLADAILASLDVRALSPAPVPAASAQPEGA